MPPKLAIVILVLAIHAPWIAVAQRGHDDVQGRRPDHQARAAMRWQPKNVETRIDLAPRAVAAIGESLMSLADLEQISLENHPAIRQAAARLSAARGRWLQVGLPPNPTVGYIGTEIGNEGQSGQQGAFLQQRIVTGGKLALNRAIVSREIQRLEQQFSAVEIRVLTDVRGAFYEVLAAQESLDLARELVRIGTEGVRTTGQLLAAQEVSRVDLLQAEIESALAANLLTEAENRIQGAWRALAALLAVPEMPLARLEGDLGGDLQQIDWPSAIERLLRESPELAAAWSDVERARFALSRAIAEPTPDINLQGSVQYDDATQNTVASVQVGLPLPLLNRNEGAIRRARAELVVARQEVARLELALQQRLADAFERYENARRQVERYRDTILSRASDSLELIRTGYAEGEFGYVNVLTAQQTYFQTNLEYIRVLEQLRRSAAMIDGLLLDGSLRENR